VDLDRAFLIWLSVLTGILCGIIVPLFLYTVFTAYPKFFTAVIAVIVVPPLLIHVASNVGSKGGEAS
jgi:Na+/H+-dicarboxylate symporter